MDSLVSTQWLADHLDDPDLRVLDASWFLPADGRDGAAEFAQAHIPGAAFFDISAIADRASPLPTMLPPPAQFAAQVGALGIGDGDRIVIYDNSPHHTSARAWWMFRAFGIPAAILDGGLGTWRAERRALTDRVATHPPASLTVGEPKLVCDLDRMRAILATGSAQVIDARSAARFAGTQPEPRPGLTPGHIPGSINLPSSTFFHADGTWLGLAELRDLFAAAGVDRDRPVTTTCGSGITAAIPLFALHLLGREAALYDGSWTQWGADPTTPKASKDA